MPISTSSLLIHLNGVTKAYKIDAGLFLALKGIALYINAGEYVTEFLLSHLSSQQESNLFARLYRSLCSRPDGMMFRL